MSDAPIDAVWNESEPADPSRVPESDSAPHAQLQEWVNKPLNAWVPERDTDLMQRIANLEEAVRYLSQVAGNPFAVLHDPPNRVAEILAKPANEPPAVRGDDK